MRDKILAARPTHRPRFDGSKLLTVDTEIRTRAVYMTMELLRNISDISEPNSYRSVSRNMMMVANSTPIKCVCMGISPYETDILPSFASALAYDPKKCIGSTPSVQALSQMMSLCAISIKNMDAKKVKCMNTSKLLDRDGYVSRFAMMLRCSYSCMSAGLVFINAAPTVTSNIAKRLRVASMLSEWLGKMASLHIEFDRQFTIVSMGALAEMCTNDILKSYPSLRKSVRLYTMVNPAIIQHMNVSKRADPYPIDSRPTLAELYLDRLAGVIPRMSVVSNFEWFTYRDDTLISLMSRTKKGIALHERGDARGAVAVLTSILVDEEPHDLLHRFTRMVESLANNISNPTRTITIRSAYVPANINTSTNDNMDDAMTFLASMPVVEDEGLGNHASSEVDASNEVRDETVFNPFLMAQANMGGNTAPSMATGMNQQSSQPRDIESYKGQHMVSKRSTIAQLTDPSGKSVSQHVIILDSMIRSLNDTLSTAKQTHEDMVQLTQRQAKLYEVMTRNSTINTQQKEEAIEFMKTFEEFCKRMMKDLEEQYGVVAALPDVVEGDRGIYEHETHPSAPMMRSIDGRTMKEFVYGEMRESAGRNQVDAQPQVPAQVAHQAHVPAPVHAQAPAQVAAHEHAQVPVQPHASFNPFLAHLAPSETVVENTDLTKSGDKSTLEAAEAFMEEYAEKISDMNEEWCQKACDNAVEEEITTVSGNYSVLAVLSVLVAEYMSVHSGSFPKESVMREMFETLGRDDDFPEFKNALADWIKNTTSAMEMFEMLDG
jgi:hypothetical protein